MKTIFKAIIQTLCGLALGAFFLYFMLEWASGCGETYTDSKGNVHINECTSATIRK